MKKQLFLLLFAIVASISVGYAQKVQSYQGSKSYTTTVGYIPGTEKYSYIVGDRGDKVYHGVYSFVGKDQRTDQYNKFVANYNLTANYKQGNLNGTYSVTATYEGKVWKYISGWIPYSASARLTGTFADGKPAGTFLAVYKDAMNYNGTVTMKNGKYVGTYEYTGPGYNSFWKMKGQLTDKGKLTGNWKVNNITARNELDMVFENDVLIRKDDKNSVTPPEVQNIAKQFAAGKLTEEQVKNKGYIIKKRTLPLDYFISYLLLLDDDDYAFNQIKGWDFSDYNAKEYLEIEQPDVLSGEGFNKIIEATKTQNAISEYKEPIDSYYSYSCYLNPRYNSENGYFYLDCNSAFHSKYGFYNQLVKGQVVLTPNQYAELITVQDSVVVLSPLYYNCSIFKLFCDNPDSARHVLLNSKELSETEKKDVKNAIESVTKKLSDKLVMEHFGKLDGFGWRRSRSIVFGDTCYYVLNNTYIICRGNEKIEALPVSLVKQLNAYQQFIRECEKTAETIVAYGNTLNSELVDQISDRANAKSKKILVKLQESFVATYNSGKIEDKELAIKNVKVIREQYFQNTDRNAELETSLNKNLLSKYKNLYKSQQELPVFNTNEGAEQYEKKLLQIKELQDNFVSINELYSTLENKHVELGNLSGKPYANVYKPYKAKYKKVMAVPDFGSTNDLSTYVSQLESIQADQQLRIDYINLHKEVEQLNSQIGEICATAKNCKRLYTALYKELPMLWDESADNINNMKSNIQMLTSVKGKLEKQDLPAFDKQMKKVKKVAEFRSALGL